MKFRKKPIVIDAYQWFGVSPYKEDIKRDVDYYRTPRLDGKSTCNYCHNNFDYHGWIDTLEGGHIVCPGDWIIIGVKGEKYPVKPVIFEETYEMVEVNTNLLNS